MLVWPPPLAGNGIPHWWCGTLSHKFNSLTPPRSPLLLLHPFIVLFLSLFLSQEWPFSFNYLSILVLWQEFVTKEPSGCVGLSPAPSAECFDVTVQYSLCDWWQVKGIDEMKLAISFHLKTCSICPLIYGVLRDHLLYKLGYYNEVKLLQMQVKYRFGN